MPDHANQPLTVYAAGPGSLMKTLMAAFERDTGIRVNLFQATTGRVLARLEAEAANTRADVFISASWDLARDLDERGWLLPYESPNARAVPPHLKTGTYVAQAVSALGIVWNHSSDTPEPADWQDLAQKEFRNRLTMPDPALSGASLDLLLGLEQARGEQAWDLLKRMRDNGLQVCDANDQALAPVLRGEKAAVFGSVDYVAYANVSRGAPIKVIFPGSGTILVPRPMMILNTSRAADRARQLIDYLLSEEGQDCAADAWLMPARSDIAIRRPSLGDIAMLPQNPTTESGRRDCLARFRAIFAMD